MRGLGLLTIVASMLVVGIGGCASETHQTAISTSSAYKNPFYKGQLTRIVVWAKTGLSSRREIERTVVAGLKPRRQAAPPIAVSSLEIWPIDATTEEIRVAMEENHIDGLLVIAEENSWTTATESLSRGTSTALPLLGVIHTSIRTTLETEEHAVFSGRVFDAKTERVVFESQVKSVSRDGQRALASTFAKALAQDIIRAKILPPTCEKPQFDSDVPESIRRRDTLRWEREPCPERDGTDS